MVVKYQWWWSLMFDRLHPYQKWHLSIDIWPHKCFIVAKYVNPTSLNTQKCKTDHSRIGLFDIHFCIIPLTLQLRPAQTQPLNPCLNLPARSNRMLPASTQRFPTRLDFSKRSEFSLLCRRESSWDPEAFSAFTRIGLWAGKKNSERALGIMRWIISWHKYFS